ncbi:E3 ubiquitin-protein ligase TRIM71-like [Branchiostoma floridae x Branchiostoma japonicum]
MGHQTTAAGVSNLPHTGQSTGLRANVYVNVYVNNLLDFAAAKKGAEPGGVPCQVCEGNVEGPKSWCADCGMLLCQSCIAMHRKVPATSDHQIVPQEDITTMGGMEGLERKRHCHKHKNQELVFYCESCNALVCTACTVVDHRPGKDHNPVEIGTVAQKRTEKLRQLLKQLDPRIKEIQDSINKAEKTMSNLIPSKEAATDQAKTYFRQLADILQKREKEILSQIDEQYRADGKALQTKKEAIEFELAGLTSAQTFCQQAVEHGSDVHILEVGNQVQTRVETLLAKQLELESDWSEFQFVENTTVAGFQEKSKDFGDVKINVDISKCKLVVKPAVKGFECVAMLTTINKDGRPYITNSKAVDVTANMKDTFGRNVQTKLQMKSMGEWEISYTPKITGNHSLEVKVNTRHVERSPFYVRVQEREKPVLTIGRKGSGVGELDGPVGVAVGKDGNIVVVDQGNKRVQIFDVDTGQSLHRFPVDGEKPFGVDVDSKGGLFVASYGSNYGVRCYSKKGDLFNSFKPDCMKQPRGVAVLQDGRMVVADTRRKSCLLLQPDGSLIREIGKGQLQFPQFMAVDATHDAMYVTDRSEQNIFVFGLEENKEFGMGRKVTLTDNFKPRRKV